MQKQIILIITAVTLLTAVATTALYTLKEANAQTNMTGTGGNTTGGNTTGGNTTGGNTTGIKVTKVTNPATGVTIGKIEKINNTSSGGGNMTNSTQ
jgi:hypothetical protein